MKNRYSVGKMAAMLGVTPGFLKYYEQNGLLQPLVDPANGYRYYEFSDLTVVPEILKLKKLGFSAVEICRAQRESDYSEIVKMLAAKKPEIEKQIRFLKSCCQYIDTVQEEEELFNHEESWSIGIHGDYYFLTLTEAENIHEHAESNHIREQWQEHFPVVSAAMMSDYRNIPKRDMKNGYAVKVNFAREYGLMLDSSIIHIPKGRYLECYDRRVVNRNVYLTHPEAKQYGVFYNIHGIIEQYNLQVTGPSLLLVRAKL